MPLQASKQTPPTTTTTTDAVAATSNTCLLQNDIRSQRSIACAMQVTTHGTGPPPVGCVPWASPACLPVYLSSSWIPSLTAPTNWALTVRTAYTTKFSRPLRLQFTRVSCPSLPPRSPPPTKPSNASSAPPPSFSSDHLQPALLPTYRTTVSGYARLTRWVFSALASTASAGNWMAARVLPSWWSVAAISQHGPRPSPSISLGISASRQMAVIDA